MNTLSNIEAAALAKAGKPDNSAIAPGTYAGSFTVKVDYTLTKEGDYDVPPTANILSKAVIAKLGSMAGFQWDNFLACLEIAAVEALSSGDAVADKVVDEKVKAKLKEIEAKVIAKLPRQPRSGATNVKASVTVIGEPVAVAA